MDNRIDQINEAAEPLSVNFRAGGLYDNVVEVGYTDNGRGQDVADGGLALNLGASWQKPVTETFGFRAGYDNYTVRYKDLHEYDVMDQTAMLEAQWVKGRFMFSLPVGYNYLLEDSRSDYSRVTLAPACTLFIVKGRQALSLFGLYARIQDKDDAVEDEDGTGSGVGGAYVVQLEDRTSFGLSLVYQSTAYDAAAADYDSGASRGSRRDKAVMANANIYFPLLSRLGLYADYVYTHNNSNASMYDYDRHVIEGGVAVKIF